MRKHFLISGQVQGVFFRASTEEKAEELGLTGWVRNISEGRVEAVFDGSKDKLGQMEKWLWQGPPGAKVTDIKEISDKFKEKFHDFEIRW